MAATERKPPVTLISTIVIILSTLFVFLPNLNSQFLLDDHILIENNPFIRQLESPAAYFAQEDGILDRENWNSDFHTRYYRPLINLSYHLDYRIWGLNPAGFHLTNWLLHLITTLLLYKLLWGLTGSGWAAFLSALLFALHPVQTEAVSWVSSRNNILATLFSLASFHFYILRNDRRYFLSLTLAVFFFCLAVFSKEFGVMLLPIIFIYDRLLKKRSLFPDKRWLAYLPFAMVLCIYLLARSHVTGALLEAPVNTPFFQRLLLAPYLVMYNLCLILIPAGLHNFLVTYPVEQVGLHIAGGGFGGVLGFILLWRCRHEKYLVFGVLSFLCGLFPVLNLVPTSAVTLVAMRWLYFPFAFLTFAICRLIGDRPGRLKIGLALFIAVCCGFYSFYLNRVHWHGDERFFTREVLNFNNPLYAGAYAKILHKKGRSELAEKYFKLGIRAFPTSVESYIDYSAMLIVVDRPRQSLAVLEQVSGLTMSRENRGIAYNNRGMALFRLGMFRAAVGALEAAVKLAPDNPGYKSNLGGAYGMVSEFGKSVAVLEEGLALDPDSVGIRTNLANSYFKMGKFRQTIQVLEKIPAAEREKHPGIKKRLLQARSRLEN